MAPTELQISHGSGGLYTLHYILLFHEYASNYSWTDSYSGIFCTQSRAFFTYRLNHWFISIRRVIPIIVLCTSYGYQLRTYWHIHLHRKILFEYITLMSQWPSRDSLPQDWLSVTVSCTIAGLMAIRYTPTLFIAWWFLLLRVLYIITASERINMWYELFSIGEVCILVGVAQLIHLSLFVVLENRQVISLENRYDRSAVKYMRGIDILGWDQYRVLILEIFGFDCSEIWD